MDKFSDSNWLPYGGIENNYGVIGAQQADAIGALVEKVVNSIDAVLMRECFARNLDPRSNLAQDVTDITIAFCILCESKISWAIHLGFSQRFAGEGARATQELTISQRGNGGWFCFLFSCLHYANPGPIEI